MRGTCCTCPDILRRRGFNALFKNRNQTINSTIFGNMLYYQFHLGIIYMINWQTQINQLIISALDQSIKLFVLGVFYAECLLDSVVTAGVCSQLWLAEGQAEVWPPARPATCLKCPSAESSITKLFYPMGHIVSLHRLWKWPLITYRDWDTTPPVHVSLRKTQILTTAPTVMLR